ncbi:MAG: DHHA1 domain-containing protein, partial [Melioribacteraceae bacterium]|nr:DHHA1 domain-containing protein [Melioribacteraceae bacterium]
ESVHVLLNHKKWLEKQLVERQVQLIHFESKELIELHRDSSIIYSHYFNRSIQELQKLAQLVITSVPNSIILLIAENEQRLQFVIGRGENSDLNLKEVLPEILPLIDGKGGGSERFVQGGGQTEMDIVLLEETCVHILEKYLP